MIFGGRGWLSLCPQKLYRDMVTLVIVVLVCWPSLCHQILLQLMNISRIAKWGQRLGFVISVVKTHLTNRTQKVNIIQYAKNT